MDKIITLIIAAAVILMVALSMIFMFSGVGEDKGNLNEAGTTAACRVQVDRYCNTGTELSDIKQSCISQAQDACGVPQDQLDEEVADRSGLPTGP